MNAPRNSPHSVLRFAAWLIVSAATSAAAQTTPAPDCKMAALNTTIRIFQAPGNIRVVAIDYANTTGPTCSLRPDGGPAQGPVLALPTGQTAHSSFRWTAKPSTPGAYCEPMTTRIMSVNNNPNGIMVTSPTLLPPLCSTVQYSAYFPGPFTPDWPATASDLPHPAPSELTTSKLSYDLGEPIDLHLRLAETPPGKACPTLLLTTREAHSITRIDEITNPGRGCHSMFELEHKPLPPNEFNLDSGERTHWDGPGERSFEASQLTGPGRDGELLRTPSNTVTLAINDPAHRERTWGTLQKGLHASLDLDHKNYPLGQDIPLHIAIEDVSANRAVYGEPFYPRTAFGSDDSGALSVSVADEDGSLPAHPYQDLMTGGGPTVCPAPYEKGKANYRELSLERLGLLPKLPGTYKLTVTWSPYATDLPDCEAAWKIKPATHLPRPYASVVSAPIFLTITGDASALQVGFAASTYTAWKQAFDLIDTPLGDKTALLDKSTHLQWLRLNFTRSLSYEEVLNVTRPGEKLEGWRIATQPELHEFFANFIRPSGLAAATPAVERKLQRLLGGPFDLAGNSQTGWRREATYGYVLVPSSRQRKPTQYFSAAISEDTSPTAVVLNPANGGPNSLPYYGHVGNEATFLVRKR